MNAAIRDHIHADRSRSSCSPVEIREKAGLLPHTEVEFELDTKGVHLRRAKAKGAAGRGAAVVGRLRGQATVRMSTDEIMALTRQR